MFATVRNRHLPQFISPVLEPRALAIDALSQDLLSQQGYVLSGKSYHLHAWRLSSCTTNQQYFQERSLSSPQLLGDPLQIECTTTGGYALLTGLQGKDLIHLVPQLLKYPLFCINFLILKACHLRLSKDTGPV